MTLEQSIEEVEMLRGYTIKVLQILHNMPEFNEGEVKLRASCLRDTVRIFNSDITSMLNKWKMEKE